MRARVDGIKRLLVCSPAYRCGYITGTASCAEGVGDPAVEAARCRLESWPNADCGVAKGAVRDTALGALTATSKAKNAVKNWAGREVACIAGLIPVAEASQRGKLGPGPSVSWKSPKYTHIPATETPMF